MSFVDRCVHEFLFSWTTASESLGKWQRYHREYEEGLRAVYLLKKDDRIIGYGSLLRVLKYPCFSDKWIPEINDVRISEEGCCKGFGRKLIPHLEHLAKEEGYFHVGLGVGLYRDYGFAQKLYWSLGYRPDGEGITYKCSFVVPGKEYPVDDDLVFWMVKPL